MKPTEVPAKLVDAAWPVCEREGIPWHDNAVRMVLAAALDSAATDLEERFQRMRENGDGDMRTAIDHVREVLRGER